MPVLARLTLLTAALAFILAAAPPCEAAPAKKPVPAKTAAPKGPVRPVKMVLTKDDGNGRRGQQVRFFKSTDNPLHCVVHLSHGKPGTKVHFIWSVIDVKGEKPQDILENVATTHDMTTTLDNTWSMARPRPPGKYRVSVRVEGYDKVTAIDFEIQ